MGLFPLEDKGVYVRGDLLMLVLTFCKKFEYRSQKPLLEFSRYEETS